MVYPVASYWCPDLSKSNLILISCLVNGRIVKRQGYSPECPEQHGVQAYAHPESCNLFFLCTNGTLTVEQCENGLLFDGKGAVHNHCNYNWAVHCGERKADRKNNIYMFWLFEMISKAVS